jgi:hypothetical protein
MERGEKGCSPKKKIEKNLRQNEKAFCPLHLVKALWKSFSKIS